jgi:hypothetical protein
MRGGRTRAGRDAATVEIVFAAVTGGGLATAGFLLLASPVMAGQAHGTAREGWFTAAVIVAAAIFCARVAVTLRRFERRYGHWGTHHEQAPEAGPEPGPDFEQGSGQVSGQGSGQGSGEGSGQGDSVRMPRQRAGSAVPDQPSQPGRTRPDS